jgi:hypothetical protein
MNKTIEIKPESVIDIGSARALSSKQMEALNSQKGGSLYGGVRPIPHKQPPPTAPSKQFDNIEDACNFLHKQGKHKEAHKMMAEHTERSHKVMEAQVKVTKEMFLGARSFGCDYCDNRPECQLYENSEKLVKDALIPLALQQLIQCEALQIRLTGREVPPRP